MERYILCLFIFFTCIPAFTVGIVPENYPDKAQLGWGKDSIGYHADNGRLYNENENRVYVGPQCKVGDRIGFGMIIRSNLKGGWSIRRVVFTRNGRLVEEMPCGNQQYFAVGMHSAGEKVKVILDAKMPRNV